MPTKSNRPGHSRRSFIKQATIGGALGSTLGGLQAQDAAGPSIEAQGRNRSSSESSKISFPRVFTGSKLRMIAFPLGGIGTGTISLGGRGQLLDWEIFNRPDKGNQLSYCFPAIWAQVQGKKPVARVLEGRMEPP